MQITQVFVFTTVASGGRAPSQPVALHLGGLHQPFSNSELSLGAEAVFQVLDLLDVRAPVVAESLDLREKVSVFFLHLADGGVGARGWPGLKLWSAASLGGATTGSKGL